MGKTDAARILLVTVLISRRELDPRAIGLYEDAPWKDGLVGGRELADSGIAERWNGKGEAGANAVWYDVAKDAWKVLAVLGGGAPSAAAGEAGQSNVLAGKEGRRKGGRPKLNAAEAHRRLSIVEKWQRAKEAGVAQKGFCSDKSITVADLNSWVNWSTQRQKRRGEST